MMDGCSAEKRIFYITPVFGGSQGQEFRFRWGAAWRYRKNGSIYCWLQQVCSVWSQFSFFQVKNGCVMAGIISLTGRSPLHLGSACSGRSCWQWGHFFCWRGTERNSTAGWEGLSGYRWSWRRFFCSCFCMELVSLQSWIWAESGTVWWTHCPVCNEYICENEISVSALYVWGKLAVYEESEWWRTAGSCFKIRRSGWLLQGISLTADADMRRKKSCSWRVMWFRKEDKRCDI